MTTSDDVAIAEQVLQLRGRLERTLIELFASQRLCSSISADRDKALFELEQARIVQGRLKNSVQDYLAYAYDCWSKACDAVTFTEWYELLRVRDTSPL
jgi:hypothetical protein